MYLSLLRAWIISSHLMSLGNALRDGFEPMMQAGLEQGKILFSTEQDKSWSLCGKMSVLQSQ